MNLAASTDHVICIRAPSKIETGGKFCDEVSAAAASARKLQIDFTGCRWIDHFEMQKFLVCLVSAADFLSTLMLRFPPLDVPSVALAREEWRWSLEVLAYMRKMDGLALIGNVFGERVSLLLGTKRISLSNESELSRFLATVSEHLVRVALGNHAQQRRERAYVPIQNVTTSSDVDDTVKTFTASDGIQRLLDYYSGLDFVESGEFATIVVHELAQNILQHAWALDGCVRPSSALSLVTVMFGDTERPDGWYAQRLKYSPEYEREFIRQLRNRRVPGYLELCVCDAGAGILETMRRGQTDETSDVLSVATATNEELLAAAFWASTTRDPGPHRPGRRGLHWVAQSVIDQGGLLVCQTGGYQLEIISNSPEWTAKSCHRDPLQLTGAADVHPALHIPGGTHFRLLFPLTTKRRRRPAWRMTFSSPAELIAANQPIELPPIPGLPSAPDPAADAKESMAQFGRACANALFEASNHSIAQPWIWLSASGMRNWRKQHMQMLLEAIEDRAPSATIVLVNVPASQFLTFIFVARHILGVEDGRAIILFDDEGRRSLIYKEPSPLYELFMEWAANKTGFLPDGGAVGALLSDLAKAHSEALDISLNDLAFIMATRGIAIEHERTLARFRVTNTVVQIDEGYCVIGFTEVDEALRESAYLRAVGSWVELVRRCGIRATGTIAIRRAAIRILESRRPLERTVWSMPSPAVEFLPTSEWLAGQRSICVLTDVIARGTTIAAMLRNIAARCPGDTKPSFVVLTPLCVELQLTTGTNGGPLRQTAVPGLAVLEVPEVGAVPVVWISGGTAEVAAPIAGISPAVPEASSNILFATQARRPKAAATTPLISALDFVKLADAQHAICLGHVSITEAHFDVEFDMSRLFKDGSAVLSHFAASVCSEAISKQIEVLLYPDESRIHLAIPAIEDALYSASASVPRSIRFRRSADGQLYCRNSDVEILERARSVMILDDAINSGGTIRQIMAIASATMKDPQQMVVFVLLSRQPHGTEEFFSGITAYNKVPVSYYRFARFPVSFFAPAECILCRRAREANTLSSGYSPHSPVRLAMLELMPKLEARVVYARIGSSWITEEPHRLYSAPAIADGVVKTIQLPTLAQARAAVAVAVGESPDLRASTVQELLAASANTSAVASYAFYAITSRRPNAEDLWENDAFRASYCHLVAQVAQVLRDVSHEDGLNETGALDLCATAAFAPPKYVAWALSRLIRNWTEALSIDRIHQELLQLALRYAAIDPATPDARDERFHPELLHAVTAARQSYSAASQGQSINAAGLLMRLRQIQQVVEGSPVREPWLDGVVHILSRLSYEAKHERIGHVSERDRARAEDLRDGFRGLLEQRAPLSGAPRDVATLRDWLQAFLKTPRGDLRHIAKAFAPNMRDWLNALAYVHETEYEAEEQVSAAIAQVSQWATVLLAELEALELIRFDEDVEVVRRLDTICDLQAKLFAHLYRQADGSEAAICAEVRRHLCSLYTVATWFPPEMARTAFGAIHDVQFVGSFFDYAQQVRLQKKDGTRAAQWMVLLSPCTLVKEVLNDILIENPKKHVLTRLKQKSRVEVQANLRGLDALDQHVCISVTVVVDGRAWPIPDGIWHKSLGHQRNVMVRVYGGNIWTETTAGQRTTVVLEFLAGYF